MAYVTAALYFCRPSCGRGRDVKRSVPELRGGEWLSVAQLGDPADDGADRVSRQRQNDAVAPRARSPALADTAVIINEIGEIAIDHHLVDFVEGSVLELPGGCLCCAVREDLARTLRGLLERRDAGEIRRFRRIVIETTGLADPAPILFTLGADPMLDHSLRLARVVTLVDAVNGADSLDRFAEAARQAALADALVITKTDLAPLGPDLVRRSTRSTTAPSASSRPRPRMPALVLFGGGKLSTAPGNTGRAGRHPHPRHRRFRRDPRRRR